MIFNVLIIALSRISSVQQSSSVELRSYGHCVEGAERCCGGRCGAAWESVAAAEQEQEGARVYRQKVKTQTQS